MVPSTQHIVHKAPAQGNKLVADAAAVAGGVYEADALVVVAGAAGAAESGSYVVAVSAGCGEHVQEAWDVDCPQVGSIHLMRQIEAALCE